MSECTECGKITEKLHTRGSSVEYGDYYKGEPICDVCIGHIYEERIAEIEARNEDENTSKNTPL